MKTFILISIVAIFMALGNNIFASNENPGDKVNTTIRCNKEKGAHPKTYTTTKSKSTVSKNFKKKHYRHMKKR